MLSIANHQRNANQNYSEISPLTCQNGYHQQVYEWLSLKSLQITNVGKDVEKREPSYTVGRNVNSCSHCGKQYGGFSKKLKIELPYDSAIPLLGIYPKKNKNTNLKRYTHPNVHSSIIYNCQDMETTCVSINRWMDKEDVVYTDNVILLSHKKRMKFCHLQQHAWI